MKNKINIDKNIADFVTEFPQTKEVFELFGLDYESFANEKILDVAKEKNIKIKDLVSSLNKKIAPKTDFLEGKSLNEIISYVEKTHHGFLWEKLPSTDMLLDSIIRVHKAEHGDFLMGIQKIFNALKNHLEEHLGNEEYDLFAIIKEKEKHPRKKLKEDKSTIISKLNFLYEDHDKANLLLAQMRNFTDDYEIPDFACMKFQELYDNLNAIENDLREHIYIENAVLFPKIKEMLL